MRRLHQTLARGVLQEVAQLRVEAADVDHAQRLALFEAAREPKELYVVEGAQHVNARWVGGAEYERRVLAFLARFLDS